MNQLTLFPSSGSHFSNLLQFCIMVFALNQSDTRGIGLINTGFLERQRLLIFNCWKIASFSYIHIIVVIYFLWYKWNCYIINYKYNQFYLHLDIYFPANAVKYPKDAIAAVSTKFKFRCNRLLFTNVLGHGRHWHNQFCIKSSIKHSLKFSSCWNDMKCHVSTDFWFDLESTEAFSYIIPLYNPKSRQ